MNQATTIFCSQMVRDLWREVPNRLAKQWFEQYPNLFDQRDYNMTQPDSQPKYHFNEWFVSIHLFQRIGARSMMEKYDQTLHHLKYERYEAFTTPEQRAELQRITEEKVDGKGVQLPDLFVTSRDESECWFVESKRVGEPVSPQQFQSHDKIRTRLGMRVDTIRVEVITG